MNCSNVTEIIRSGQGIRSNDVIFGYEDGDLTKKVEMRITGVLSKFIPNENNRLSIDGETILIDSVGESIEDDGENKKEILANSWIYNTATISNITPEDTSGGTFKLDSKINKSSLKKGDKVRILKRNRNPLAIITDSDVVESDAEIIGIDESANSITIAPSISLATGQTYDLERLLNKSSSKGAEIEYGNNVITSDVQNVYNELDKNLYVGSNSLPSYEIDENISSASISSSNSVTIQGYNATTRKYSIISFSDAVPFVTGDSIKYKTGTNKLTWLREVFYIGGLAWGSTRN